MNSKDLGWNNIITWACRFPHHEWIEWENGETELVASVGICWSRAPGRWTALYVIRPVPWCTYHSSFSIPKIARRMINVEVTRPSQRLWKTYRPENEQNPNDTNRLVLYRMGAQLTRSEWHNPLYKCYSPISTARIVQKTYRVCIFQPFFFSLHNNISGSTCLLNFQIKNWSVTALIHIWDLDTFFHYPPLLYLNTSTLCMYP